MNSQRVTQLVKNYKCIKGDCNPSRKLKEALMKSILNEYESILHKLISTININSSEVIALFNYKLLDCINKYDATKEIAFNTYFFCYIKAIRREIFAPSYKYESLPEDSDVTSISEIELTDLTIDLPKILTSEELLILRCFQNGKSDRRGSKMLCQRLDTIYNKIRNYLC